jgi:hypothetical protein
MPTLIAAYQFCIAHLDSILLVVSVVAYVIANAAPRPDPVSLTGWRKAFWGTIDRICFLTAARVPGVFKALFAPTTPAGTAQNGQDKPGA